MPSCGASARKEVPALDYIASFILMVAAGVVVHCISKWLDDEQ